MLVGDGTEDVGTHVVVLDQNVGIAAGDVDVRLREHHAHVVDRRAEERPVGIHRPEQGEVFVGVPVVADEPFDGAAEPNHAGIINGHWVQPNTHGIARRSSMAFDVVRDAGRLSLSVAISLVGVIAWKNDTKRSLRTYTSVRYASKACDDNTPMVSA